MADSPHMRLYAAGNRSRHRTGKAALLAALLLPAWLAGCDRPASAPVQTAIALTECRLPEFDGQARCGWLEVPEDRAAPNGRKIRLRLAVLPAYTRNPQPDPLFLLAGGPGQAASEMGLALGLFESVRRDRDIVLLDQRGTGQSNPLTCGPQRSDLSQLDPDVALRELTECAAGITAKRADPRHYTTREFITDLDAVRGALGYAQINLWAVSYGTRAALGYASQFPDRVRAMVLDGVAPPEMRLSLEGLRNGEAALQKLFDDCQADAGCKAAFPTLAADWQALMNQLSAQPAKAEVAWPGTGRKTPIKITATLLADAMQRQIYLPEYAALAPYLMKQAKAGDFTPLLAAALRTGGNVQEKVSLGTFLSVVCSEDLPTMSAAEQAQAAALPLFGTKFQRLKEACAIWPHRPQPLDLSKLPRHIPALLYSGGLDPATPPVWAEAVAKRLDKARHVVAPGLGHNVFVHPCVPRMTTRFIREPDPATLDAACVESLGKTTRPPFFLSATGGQP